MIIGLGTGRCGTVSLSRVLRNAGLNVTHELKPVMNWQTGKGEDRLNYLNSRGVEGDVAFWYLNFVEEMNEACDDIRFVCLQRNVDEVIDSYTRKTNGRNHWMHHDGSNWRLDFEWDQCYPKYDVQDKSEGIRLYWEEYQKRSSEYQDKMENFKVFDTNCLNSKEGVQSIFDFLNLGIKVSEDLVNIRLNRC